MGDPYEGTDMNRKPSDNRPPRIGDKREARATPKELEKLERKVNSRRMAGGRTQVGRGTTARS